MKKISEKETEKAFNQKKNEAEDLLNNPDKLEEFLQKLEKKIKKFPKIGDKMAYIPIFASLIKSYIKKEYTDIPVGTIAAVIGATVYFVALADIIPDFIPFMGYIDDAGVLLFALKSVGDDVKKYTEWRKNTGREQI